jgi:hypothetical protein
LVDDVVPWVINTCNGFRYAMAAAILEIRKPDNEI